MQRSKLVQHLAVLLLIALLAMACGDDGAGTAGEAATDPVEEPTATGTGTPAEAGGGEGTQSPAAGGDGGPLVLGTILPETGDLAYLAPPMTQAVAYAVEQINEAGGVLGQEIPEVIAGDEAGDEAIANQSADRLLAEQVDAIIGAAASGMSLAIIDKVTGAGVVQCSGSNTTATFTDYPDDGFYVRTAPSDALQGPVLAELIISGGAQNVAILARADDYGRGLAEAVEAALTEAGATAQSIIYDPNASNFAAEVQQALSTNPDAIAVIAFAEGAQVIQSLIEAGFPPEQLYGSDGVRSSDLPGLVDPNNPNVLDGMQGTAPAPETDEQFIQEFVEATGVQDTIFAPQKFDCVNVVALAAEAAGSTDPTVFKDFLVDVTREGTECTSFAECKELLAAGEDINYQGVSGPLDFIDAGEPGTATYELWTFENGELVTVDTVQSTLPELQG